MKFILDESIEKYRFQEEDPLKKQIKNNFLVEKMISNMDKVANYLTELNNIF